MKTVVSKTGIEVLYPCTIHLLKNGEILDCEYKSDHLGQDLLDYICQYQNLSEKEYWGLRFVDIFDHKHWLELDQLIRPQVKNVCPVHFHFRVKVYPAEPHKIKDAETRQQLFMQLRYDLITGRLCCEPNDSALILGLVLQYTYGDFNGDVHFGNYVRSKIMLNQTFNVETRAIDIHKQHLSGLTKAQVEDLFLRMACQLQTYGVDPHIIEDKEKRKLTLWINYKGIVAYFDGKVEDHIRWMDISKITQDCSRLIISTLNKNDAEFVCADEAECKYIYRSVLDHLVFFTSSGRKSTVTLIGSDQADDFDIETIIGNNIHVVNNEKPEVKIQDDENKDCKLDHETIVNYPRVAKKAIEQCTLKRVVPQIYVTHCIVLIVGIGMFLELYAIYTKGSSGVGFLGKYVNDIVSKYILKIN